MRRVRGDTYRLMYDVKVYQVDAASTQRREGTQALSGKKYVIASTEDQSCVLS